MNENTIARFWKKVNKNGPLPTHKPELGPCWLWTASIRNKGYGAFGYTDNGVTVQDRAHRFSFVLHNGGFLESLCVLHDCDTPSCVNPAHLFLGTKADNNADMLAKGRHVKGGTHCGSGSYERGINHHNAKLTEETVRNIRTDKASGMSYSKLREKYGLAIGYLHRLVNRKAWKHV